MPSHAMDRFVLLLALAGLPLAGVARSTPRSDALVQAGVVQLPVTAHPPKQAPHGLDKRGAVQAALEDQISMFTIDLSLGTPPQKVTLIVDIGSHDIWVNPDCDRAACSRQEVCRQSPKFNERKSCSYRNASDDVDYIGYGNGGVQILWSHDRMSIGSMAVKDQIFGLGMISEVAWHGVFGIAPDFKMRKLGRNYTSIVDSLYMDGLTNRPAFGLGLGYAANGKGTITFGGLDVKKFSGRLEKRGVEKRPDRDEGDEYYVRLDGISVNRGESISLDDDAKVLLDSGSTISTFDKRIVDQIAKFFPGAELVDIEERALDPCDGSQRVPSPSRVRKVYTVDCAARNSNGTLDFTFGKSTFGIPYQDLIQPLPDADQRCMLTLGMVEGVEINVLGRQFLTNAYMVADWDDNAVYLGNSADCGSKLVALDKETDIGSIQGECGPSTTDS